MNAYAIAGWENFFVAEAGAAAALSGLLFVAVSINLTRILAFPQLPERAGEALVILMGVLLASTLGLVPGQSRQLLGGELLALSVVLWVWPVWLQRAVPHPPNAPRWWMVNRVIMHQSATLPFVAAGVSLVAGAGGGLYWLVPGTVFSFGAGLMNAWVLLVEIQR